MYPTKEPQIIFIYHLKGGSMKNVTYTTYGVTIFVFNGLYRWPSNSLLRTYITNLETLPYLLHFSEVLKRMLKLHTL